jgi:hypothetical protein
MADDADPNAERDSPTRVEPARLRHDASLPTARATVNGPASARAPAAQRR